ncbi:hypothetical protein GDO81_021720 [Engystomops pustulosus]|uniref:Secreted protein n=1 Tax=Engystomops pustulosus TaxID=76066 RepID=A0AAV6YPT0_ENGPU|nr:hypothetical protein GDO81_021720 [Engystomops pustulosus]
MYSKALLVCVLHLLTFCILLIHRPELHKYLTCSAVTWLQPGAVVSFLYTHRLQWPPAPGSTWRSHYTIIPHIIIQAVSHVYRSISYTQMLQGAPAPGSTWRSHYTIIPHIIIQAVIPS